MNRVMKGAQVLDYSKIKFPKWGSVKVDGFRCYVTDKAYTSRFKEFPNRFVHETFKGLLPKKVSLDGEIVVGKRRGKGVLQRTSSGVTSKAGEPEFTLWVFDAPRKSLTFEQRLRLAKQLVKDLNHPRVKFLKHVWLESLDDMLKFLEWALKRGFEGIMLDDPEAPHKEGKSTLRENYRLKVKPFVTREARIIGYYEEMENTNEAVKDATGKSKRSSAKAGKKPKGTLGGFIGLDLETDVEVRVGGGFSAKQRKEFWKLRKSMLGQIMTYQKQVAGEKDKPRHPSFKAIRPVIDMDIDSV